MASEGKAFFLDPPVPYGSDRILLGLSWNIKLHNQNIVHYVTVRDTQ